MSVNAVLIFGGNKGNREKLILAALEAISLACEVKLQSRIYETEAWGGVAKGKFLNQIIEVETDLTPLGLLERIQQIETVLGRRRAEPWGDRTMDIDILYYDGQVIDHPRLTVPHPYIQERRFVLAPLAEILPDFAHPVLGKSSLEMLEDCPDKSDVIVYGEGVG